MTTALPSPFPVSLRKRADFVRIQKSDRRWVTPGFVLSYEIAAENADIDATATEIGFTVTKKLGNAVVRNRIKRRLRHLVRDIVPDLNLGGWRIVLLARHDSLTRDYADLGKDLRWAVRKLREQHHHNAPDRADAATHTTI